MGDMDEYKKLFVNKTNEYTESLNTLVLDLEKDGTNIPLAQEVMRIVHSIKGMSAVMEYQSLADISHELETILTREIKEGKISPKLIGPLFVYIDKLQEFIQLVEIGDDISGVDMGDLVEQIADIEALCLNLGKRLECIVKFKHDAKMKGVRAFMVIQNLETISKVLSSNPTREQLESGAVFDELVIEIMTKEDEDVIKNQIMASTDVIEVSINYYVARKREEGIDEEKVLTSRDIQTVRVSLKDLDVVMNLLGELMIVKGSMSSLIENTAYGQSDNLNKMDQIIFDIQEKIMSMRMVSLDHILSRFSRVVRDIALSEGKKIELQIVGKDIELDRSVIDPLNEILLHLVRNAVSHGIENPTTRIASNKPEVGNIRIIARTERDGVQVDVEDNGQGINMEAIQQKAIRMGLVREGQRLSRAELTRYIFSSGFSTRDESDEISGRGYGLNIVSRRLDEINGDISIRTKRGVGTNFSIKFPLTIAIQQALLVEIRGQKFALPLNNVQTVLLVNKDKIIQHGSRKSIVLRGKLIPVIEVKQALKMTKTGPNIEIDEDTAELSDKNIIVIWEKGSNKLGLIVENLLGQQDIVIKQLDVITSQVRGFSGASIVGEGGIILILDPQAISESYA